MGETNCCLQHFDMAGKVILVTGGNKGIGLAIVETLLKQLPEALVLLGSRDAGRGENAVASVKAKLGSGVEGRVKLLLLDVTSQESVDQALEVVKAEHSSIYGVINNAGGMGGGPRNTIDLNTYGVRRVCEAFAPLIQAGGRIVQVSSGSAPMFVEKCSPEMKEFCVKQDVTWKEIEGHLIKPFLNLLESDCPEDRTKALESKGYGTRSEGNWGEYGLSKAAVNCYTIELGKRFPHITSTSCSPGFIETDLTRGFATRSGKTPQEMGMLTVEMGARCPVYLMTGDLASLPGFTSGWYFGSDSLRSPLHKYRSPGTAAYGGEFP